MHMQDYKCQCAVAKICATLLRLGTQTHRQTALWPVYMNSSASWAKSDTWVLSNCWDKVPWVQPVYDLCFLRLNATQLLPYNASVPTSRLYPRPASRLQASKNLLSYLTTTNKIQQHVHWCNVDVNLFHLINKFTKVLNK